MTQLTWSDLDRRAVDTIRALAMDAVEKAGNGHPGTAMSLAPAAYLLFQRVMRHDPTDPGWIGRDRFVLSCGHSSLTLYIQLYLSGYGLTLEDLKAYRCWGSLTPGHPEHGVTPGVETTTGPLGQGLANAVGMAMAARRERGLFDPDAPPGTSPFDHHVYVFASDGDTGLGYLGWLMMRTNPFSVRAQEAQPCWISSEIHSSARRWSSEAEKRSQAAVPSASMLPRFAPSVTKRIPTDA